MKLIKILYPDRCPKCDRAMLETDSGFCRACEPGLKILSFPYCLQCGREVKEGEEYCSDCRGRKRNFDGGRFSFSYDYIAESIYRFKYGKRPGYAKGYASVLYKDLQPWLETKKIDALIPVPLHKKRFLKRGYNQSERLAHELSKLTDIPVNDRLVKRIKNTLPQKKLDRLGRQFNVKNAFIVKGNDVKLDNVILIDDIYTTGSTIDSLARVLKEHGVKKVFFITISAAGT